jgi:hypothetical protein
VLDLSDFYERRDSVRTYKEIADFVMSKIAELGEQDRAARALEARRDALNTPGAEARPSGRASG